MPEKPLGIKAYGHIPHLPGSRMGPSDHHCHEGQRIIATGKARDRHDRITVTEKVDGSCVAVARIGGVLVPLGRAGYPAISSPYLQHRMFNDWAFEHQDQFLALLQDGERVVGEWLAQAHGTRYALSHDPFVAFDLIDGGGRLPITIAYDRFMAAGFVHPHLIHDDGPLAVDMAMAMLKESFHGALDPVEGVVWRVERKGKFDFLAKWVRPDKVDRKYLPEISGQPEVWNWRPADKH